MTKKIIIHIGTFKTGTTSIQTYFAENEEALSTNGLNISTVHREFITGALGHHNLALLWQGYTKPETELLSGIEEWRKVAVESDSVQGDLVVSTEALCLTFFRSEQAIRDIKLALEDRCVEFVIYLRRQELYAYACYNQNVKGGMRYDDFSFNNPPEGNEFYDYYKLINRVKNNYPNAVIKVRPYEKEQMLNGDSVYDFMSTINYPIEELSLPVPHRSQSNVSLTPRKLEVCKLLNKLNENKDIYERNKINYFILNNIECSDEVSYYEQESIDFYNQFHSSNKQVAQEYLNKGALFVNKPSMRSGVPKPSILSHEFLISIIDRVYRIYDARYLNELDKMNKLQAEVQQLLCKFK